MRPFSREPLASAGSASVHGVQQSCRLPLCQLGATLKVAAKLERSGRRLSCPSVPQQRPHPPKSGIFEPLELDAQDRLYSEQLGLYLKAEGEMLRLIRANGEPVLTKDERIAQLEALLCEKEKSQGR
jgi:hypothetical protein